MKPTLKKQTEHGDIFEHPAFGVITMSSCHHSGGGNSLFGSDIGHNQYINIEIRQADLTRNLGKDWIHGTTDICRFSMSHAQFAQFITSTGKGDGTPITLEYYRNGPLYSAEHIEKIETKHETHKREIKESAEKSISDIKEQVDKLEELLKSGSIGKKVLTEIVHKLKCRVDNAPENLAFTVSQAEKELEKSISDAKIEVESFIAMKSQQLGLEHISDLLQLEKK